MARNRLKAKGRRESGSFVPIPHSVLKSSQFAALSFKAVKLLLDICADIRFGSGGSINNGDQACTISVMEKRGWKSKDTLLKAQQELEESGFIIRTRQGGRNLCNLFAVSFFAIDECEGKLDLSSTNRAPNDWKNWNP